MLRWERFAPLTGIVAVALWVIGEIIVESSDRPDGDDGADAFLSWIQDSEAQVLTGGILFGFGCVFFVWFLGTLWSALNSAEGGTARLSAVAFGSGILVALSALMLVAPPTQAAFDTDNLTGETVRTLTLVGESFFAGVELFSIPMLVATALVILRTGVFPRWVAWVSLALALLLMIVPIGWLGVIFGVPLWIILMSVLLFRRPALEPVAMRTPAA